VALEIGRPPRGVQVKAETPLLDTSTTSMGQVLSSKAVLDLPLLTGNVTPMPDCLRACCSCPLFPKDVRPFDTGSGSAIAGDGPASAPPNSSRRRP